MSDELVPLIIPGEEKFHGHCPLCGIFRELEECNVDIAGPATAHGLCFPSGHVKSMKVCGWCERDARNHIVMIDMADRVIRNNKPHQEIHL